MSREDAVRRAEDAFRQVEERVTRSMALLGEALREMGVNFNELAELIAEMKAEDPAFAAALDEELTAPQRPVRPRMGRKPVTDFGPTRYCEACGKELVRKRSPKTGLLETGPHFLARRFCNQQCYGAIRRTVPAITVKTCLECGDEFTRPENEGHAKFRTRKFCSRSCASRARYRTVPLQPDSKPKAPRVKASEPRPAPRPKPQPPRPVPDKRKPPRVPQAPIKASTYDAPTACISSSSRPAVYAFEQPRETARMEVLGEPCPDHPTEKINAWGKCPACVAGGKWAERERTVIMRPHPDGGR